MRGIDKELAMKEIRIFRLNERGAPDENMINECIEIARKKDCIVRLEWIEKTYNYPIMQVDIDKEDDIKKVKNKIKTSYFLQIGV